MEEVFTKNAVKPGDKDFVYDKKVEFGDADEENSWDEDVEDYFDDDFM